MTPIYEFSPLDNAMPTWRKKRETHEIIKNDDERKKIPELSHQQRSLHYLHYVHVFRRLIWTRLLAHCRRNLARRRRRLRSVTQLEVSVWVFRRVRNRHLGNLAMLVRRFFATTTRSRRWNVDAVPKLFFFSERSAESNFPCHYAASLRRGLMLGKMAVAAAVATVHYPKRTASTMALVVSDAFLQNNPWTERLGTADDASTSSAETSPAEASPVEASPAEAWAASPSRALFHRPCPFDRRARNRWKTRDERF